MGLNPALYIKLVLPGKCRVEKECLILRRIGLMPEDGQEHVLDHMLLPSRSSFGYKTINLLSWCEAPIGDENTRYGIPVGHKSGY